MKKRWQDWVMLAFGIWLFFSPYFLDYLSVSGPAAWNSYIFGIVLVVMAGFALADRRIWEEWVNVVVGAWLFISPFIVGFYGDNAATWNHMILGVLVVIDAIWAIAQSPVRRHA